MISIFLLALVACGNDEETDTSKLEEQAADQVTEQEELPAEEEEAPAEEE